ncbi:hypothetical protein PR048_012149 [Dryococelus australis]|uniref:Uncharacterized protein n=1 Tax=Dryococelus australis TaxID=614101 RepID=A0ABQ9HNK6_9NEOP|nr:hypothetical protein PR048_012149 [Dryococelus australis]
MKSDRSNCLAQSPANMYVSAARSNSRNGGRTEVLGNDMLCVRRLLNSGICDIQRPGNFADSVGNTVDCTILCVLEPQILEIPYHLGGEGELAMLPQASAHFPGICHLICRHKANRVQSPTGSLPDFRLWESCHMMSLVGGFTRGSSVSSAVSFRHCSILTLITLIGSQDLAVKSRPNLFTHLFVDRDLKNLRVRDLQARLYLTNMHTLTADWLSAVTAEGEDWASVLQEVSNTRRHQKLRPLASLLRVKASAGRVSGSCVGDLTHTVCACPITSRIDRHITKPACIAPEYKGGGNGRSPRKPAEQRHCPPCFPHVRVREWPGRGFNSVCLGRSRAVAKWFREETEIIEYGTWHAPAVHLSRVDHPLRKEGLSRALITRGTIARVQAKRVRFNAGVTAGFSHAQIVLDDATHRRVLSVISRFPRPYIPVQLNTHLASPSSALKTSMLRAAQISNRWWPV